MSRAFLLIFASFSKIDEFLAYDGQPLGTHQVPRISDTHEAEVDVTAGIQEDCARWILEILADPERSDEICKAGRARALRDHTYEVRWTAPLRLAGLFEE